MTTNEERLYYIQSSRQVAALPSAVVDLGCWMGSTTLFLVHGLEAAGCKEEIVHSFDRFLWDD